MNSKVINAYSLPATRDECIELFNWWQYEAWKAPREYPDGPELDNEYDICNDQMTRIIEHMKRNGFAITKGMRPNPDYLDLDFLRLDPPGGRHRQ
jgi:hypothetical protein